MTPLRARSAPRLMASAPVPSSQECSCNSLTSYIRKWLPKGEGTHPGSQSDKTAGTQAWLSQDSPSPHACNLPGELSPHPHYQWSPRPGGGRAGSLVAFSPDSEATGSERTQTPSWGVSQEVQLYLP